VADDHAVASLLLSRFNFLRRPGLHVVHIAAEMVPVAKVGGLGDVVTGLAKAHQQRWGRVDARAWPGGHVNGTLAGPRAGRGPGAGCDAITPAFGVLVGCKKASGESDRPATLQGAPERPGPWARPFLAMMHASMPNPRCRNASVTCQTNRIHDSSGILCEVVLPKYDICDYAAVSDLRMLRVIDVAYDGRKVPTRVWSAVVEG
jgi:hypothetical protein